MTAKSLIKAIHEGKSSDIQAEFTDLMNEKLQNAIESYRIALTESLFDQGYDLEFHDFTSLDEGSLGNLEGLPKHMVKVMTRDTSNINYRAGKDSPVERTHTKTASEFNSKIKGALAKGHHVAVHVDGKVVGGITNNIYASSNRDSVRPHNANDAEKSTSHSSAVSRMHGLIGNTNPDETKALFKNKKIEVSAIGSDSERSKKRREREKRSVKDTFYTDGHKPTKRSKDTFRIHNAGSFEDTNKKAAEKIAAKKVNSDDSTRKTTDVLHKNLTDAIANNNHIDALRASRNLASHIERNGIGSNSDEKRKEYADTLLKLQKNKKSYNWDTKYDKERLAKLRNESVDESEDVTLMLEAALQDLIDIIDESTAND